MSKYTKQDILRMVEEEDVEFIRLQFIDIFGNLKNTAVTTSQIEKILNNQCSFDCGAIEGFDGMERPELFLYPDLDTFEIFPWRPQQGKVARFLCDVYTPDGEPFEGDSRHILKKVIDEAQSLGVTFQIGPECEFFLFDLDENGELTTNTHEQGSYFDVGPIDSGENARRDIVLTLEDMGFEVESSFHADAPAQHEIDFKHSDPLKAADNILTFKLVVRTVARRHGMHATFMPKPKTGIKGSGMHINFSMYQDGKNVFGYGQGEISDTAKSFIAGMLKHIKGMCLFTNPTVNSYKRLVPGYEAPVYIGWSNNNLSPLIRIPVLYDGEKRIELRSPDSASNPYLALAVCIAAGLDGVKKGLEAPKSMDLDMRNMAEQQIQDASVDVLPSDLSLAIKEFEEDEFVKEVVGRHIAERFLVTKKKEWKEYNHQVSSWEVEKYLKRI